MAAMRAWRAAQWSRVGLEAYQTRGFAKNHQSIEALVNRGEDAPNTRVKGWVRSIRKQKKVAFADVGDGSTLKALQAVLKPEAASR